MGEFKVGDKVRALTDSAGRAVRAGDVVTVTDSDGEGWIRFEYAGGRTDGWHRDKFELVETPKFAVGQWVRVLRPDYPGTIDVGAIAKVINADDHGVTLLGPAYGLFFYNSELEPWAPRAGERVRVPASANSVWAGDAEMVAHHAAYGTYELKMQTGARAGDSGDFLLSEIEPLPVAVAVAPLQLQAGKFYKTRDGRKVGPLVEDEDDCFPFISHDLSETWRADGTWSLDRQEKHRLDLIAEWTDTPIVTAATVDAINEEYGPAVREAPVAVAKFKVGDLVKHTSLGYVGTVEDIIDAETVKTYWPGEGWGGCDPIIDLELATTTPAIVALITDGKPQPATKPKVHDSQELATKEAERLALANPGQQFGIFVLADSKIADEVVTKTAVLRAA
jgi:hypothetical protein